MLLVPPIASLKVTAEVPLLALFTEEASACDAAVEVDWTVASAAELKFRLCRPAAEIVSVVVAVVAMEGKGGGRYTQPPNGPCPKPYALCARKTDLLNRDLRPADCANSTALDADFCASVLLKRAFSAQLAIRSAQACPPGPTMAKSKKSPAENTYPYQLPIFQQFSPSTGGWTQNQ